MPSKLLEITCKRKDCNKIFKGHKYRQYCSHKCSRLDLWNEPSYKLKRSQPRVARIKKICPNCNTEFEVIPKHRDRRCCGNSCHFKYLWKTEPEKMARAQRIGWIDNPSRSKDQSKLLSDIMRDKWANDSEFRRRSIERLTSNRSYRHGRHESPKCGSIHYRSSYELRAYQILDLDDNVVSYETETIELTYTHPETGRLSYYYPDLLIKYKDGSKGLIEIKPLKHLKDEVITNKHKAAMEYCKFNNLTWNVWTEHNLFK